MRSNVPRRKTLICNYRGILCPSTIAARAPMRALRNVKFLSAALLCVAMIGTAGFHFIEHWSWFDGFYMVLTTLTTIGYGEVHPLSQVGRYFNVGIILAGVGLVFLILGALGQALLEFEFNNLFGRRKMEREIERLQGHYIICGAGRVGRAVARQLESNPAQFIILENNEAKAERIREETNWLVVHADATLEAQLLAARIDHAAGLVAATTTDATNTYVVLTARSLNPTLKIIARASEEGAEKHMRTAGADQVISPYGFAGFRIAQAFLRPHVINFLEVALLRSSELGLELEELTIDPSSVYVGQGLRSSGIRHDLGITVLAIKREGEEMKYSPARRCSSLRGRSSDCDGRAFAVARIGIAGRSEKVKITTAAEMSAIDRATSQHHGVDSLTLMENAGSAVANFAREHWPAANRITVVCGRGNNGGDGFVAARRLHAAGKVVEVLLLGPAEGLKADAASMLARLPLRPIVLCQRGGSCAANMRAVWLAQTSSSTRFSAPDTSRAKMLRPRRNWRRL